MDRVSLLCDFEVSLKSFVGWTHLYLFILYCLGSKRLKSFLALSSSLRMCVCVTFSVSISLSLSHTYGHKQSDHVLTTCVHLCANLQLLGMHTSVTYHIATWKHYCQLAILILVLTLL